MPPEAEKVLNDATRKFRRQYRSSGCRSIWDLILFGVVLIVVLWGLKLLGVLSLSNPIDKLKSSPVPTQSVRPSYEMIGAYETSVLYFNRSTKKIYAYDAKTDQETFFCDLVPYESFVWAPDQKYRHRI